MDLRRKAKEVDRARRSLRRKSRGLWKAVSLLEERRLEMEKRLFISRNDVRKPCMARGSKRVKKRKKDALVSLWKQVMGDVEMPKKEEK